jgi:predicted esterase YcpF (UPF0227 family)
MYYIHGFLSSPNGTKGTLLKNSLDVIPIKYRYCEPDDLVISDCINRIKQVVKKDAHPILIGSSLGGYLAARTALEIPVSTLILLNPAIIPPDENLNKISDMPKRILNSMMDDRLFSEKIHGTIIIFIGTNDTIVPNRWGIDFAKAQEAEIHFFHDDHRFSKNISNLPNMISDVLR